ncbi:MAG: LPS-assembly protein [Paraglaciecola sp.]|jgi:LPS-assembly protein
MQINQFLFLSFLCSLSALANAQQICLAPVQAIDVETNLPEGQIQVKAVLAQIEQDTVADFQGKVEIISDDAKINADSARIDRKSQELRASGNVSYQNPQLMVKSKSVLLNTTSKKLVIEDTNYQLTTVNGRGKAEKITISENRGIDLQEVSFSSCPVGEEDWRIQASSIQILPDEQRGEVKHARFYVKNIPVLYLPYFSFPVTDVRQTGLLFPKFSSSSATGLSYEQPFYWNIAPNYDATISPRMMSNRGLQLKTEFRYLSEHQSGQVDLEYLANDRDTAALDDRYFYRFSHFGQLTDNWQINAEVNGLSDSNYIVDLGSEYYNRADTHLYQTVGVNYYSTQLDFSLQFRDFELLGDHPNSYRALPEMKLNYHSENDNLLAFSIDSELAYFDNNSPDSPTALRIHLAPKVSLPYQGEWGEFLAETSILHTNYQQRNIENTALEEEVSRTLGQASLYGALEFERPASWFGETVTQTLEPKVQYLFTSFQDQSNIGLYDTTKLFNDFSGLFRGQEFTGLDRISDKSQITIGVTSRVIDKNNREQFKLSLGQIFYLKDNRVAAATKEADRSALAAELDWQIGSKWFFHTEAQLSTLTEKVERSSLALEYQLSDSKVVQINHRYVRELSSEEINQVGITASWPLAKNWHWVGRWYHDLDKHRTIESYGGVQYESCCWAMRLVVQRHLSNRFDNNGIQSTNEFDSGVGFQFIFKGLGGSSSNRSMLKDGLFGYRQPYLLN